MFVYLRDLFGCKRYGTVQDELTLSIDTQRQSEEESKVSGVAQRALPIASASLASGSLSSFVDGAKEAAGKAFDEWKDFEVFGSALQEGGEQALQEIRKRAWFKQVSVDRLGGIFAAAALGGNLSVVQEIIRSDRFKDIPAVELDGIGDAFNRAALEGHLSVVQEIIRSNRFKDIPVEGLFGLGNTFVEAALRGHLPVVLEMMSSDFVFQKTFPELLMKIKNKSTNSQLNVIDKYSSYLRQIRRLAPVLVFQRSLHRHPFRDSIRDLNGIIGKYLGV